MFGWLEIRRKRKIARKYLEAGTIVGDCASYAHLGEAVGMESFVESWAKWERKYAALGFRTISLDEFIKAGGYGQDIKGRLYVLRRENEEPVYHAELYKQHYLGKIRPVVNVNLLTSEVQVGEFLMPSTEIFTDGPEQSGRTTEVDS